MLIVSPWRLKLIATSEWPFATIAPDATEILRAEAGSKQFGTVSKLFGRGLRGAKIVDTYLVFGTPRY